MTAEISGGGGGGGGGGIRAALNDLNGKKFWKRWSPMEKKKLTSALQQKNGDAPEQNILSFVKMICSGMEI